jgi:hypothetical protein
MAGATLIAYIFGEGLVDASSSDNFPFDTTEDE